MIRNLWFVAGYGSFFPGLTGNPPEGGRRTRGEFLESAEALTLPVRSALRDRMEPERRARFACYQSQLAAAFLLPDTIRGPFIETIKEKHRSLFSELFKSAGLTEGEYRAGVERLAAEKALGFHAGREGKLRFVWKDYFSFCFDFAEESSGEQRRYHYVFW